MDLVSAGFLLGLVVNWMISHCYYSSKIEGLERESGNYQAKMMGAQFEANANRRHWERCFRELEILKAWRNSIEGKQS